MHRLSVSRAPERRMAFSRRRERRISVWSCLPRWLAYVALLDGVLYIILTRYLPTSNAGLPIGLNSVTMVKMPSNLRSGSGAVTLHEILTRTLVLPIRTSATPYSSPKSIDIGRYWPKARLSSLRFSRSAESKKLCSLVDGSFSRGIAPTEGSSFNGNHL